MAKDLYRAKDVTYSEQAEAKIAMFTEQGFGHLPICMAKTQYSFSHDANLKAGNVHSNRPIGPLVHWSIGPFVHWSTGPFIGPLAPPPSPPKEKQL